jgi:hypothetical protein
LLWLWFWKHCLMVSLGTSLLFNPALNKALSVIDGDSMAGVVVRDTMQNNGMVAEETKRNPYYGKQMWVNMWAATLIWGFGVKTMQAIYDKTQAAMGRPRTDMDMDVLHEANTPALWQQWETKGKASASPTLQKAAEAVHNITRIADEPISIKQLIALMEPIKLGRFMMSSVIPSATLGFVVTVLARHLRNKELAQAHPDADLTSLNMGPQAALHGVTQSAAVTQPSLTHTPPTLADAPLPNPFEPLKAASPSPTVRHLPVVTALSAQATATQPSFGAAPPNALMGDGFTRLIHTLNSNEALATLVGVDTLISGGRILSSENWQEGMEWTVQELAFVSMIYFLAPWANTAIKHQLGKLNPAMAPYVDMNFKGVELVHKRYVQPYQQAGQFDATAATQAFKADVHKGLAELGITPTGHANSEAMAQHLLDNSNTFKHAIQQAMLPDAYKPGENLILDMAVDSGVLKVIREGREEALHNHGLKGLWHRQALAMDPVKSLPLAEVLHKPNLKWHEWLRGKFDIVHVPTWMVGNPETLQGLAHTLWHLAEQTSTPEAIHTLQHLMMATQGSKALALGASLAINYVALAHLTPKFKHWLSKHASGGNWTDKIGTTPATGQQAGTTHTSSSQATLSGQLPLGQHAANLAELAKENPFAVAKLNQVQGSYTPPLPWVKSAATA